jgi:hypothetical protein
MDGIKRKLKCSPEHIVLNWPAGEKHQEIQEGDWWVWAGLTKPGKHTVVIRGLDSGFYSRNIAVGVRQGEFKNLTLVQNDPESPVKLSNTDSQ